MKRNEEWKSLTSEKQVVVVSQQILTFRLQKRKERKEFVMSNFSKPSCFQPWTGKKKPRATDHIVSCLKILFKIMEKGYSVHKAGRNMTEKQLKSKMGFVKNLKWCWWCQSSNKSCMAWCGDTFRDKNVHLIRGQKKEKYFAVHSNWIELLFDIK